MRHSRAWCLMVQVPMMSGLIGLSGCLLNGLQASSLTKWIMGACCAILMFGSLISVVSSVYMFVRYRQSPHVLVWAINLLVLSQVPTVLVGLSILFRRV